MKPILFNTEMVQAILDGRKTVTRRVIKYKYSNTEMEMRTDKHGARLIEIQKDVEGETYGTNEDGSSWRKLRGYIEPKPHYRPGDVLYVQETWKIDNMDEWLLDMQIKFKAMEKGCFEEVISVNFEKERFDKFKKFYPKNGWQSPYFMPKEAARLFLRITDVRVERLHDITEEQAINEGAWTTENACPFSIKHALHPTARTHAIAAFAYLWDSTIKKNDLPLYGWDVNPYVWVYEFEVISKEEAMKESEEK